MIVRRKIVAVSAACALVVSVLFSIRSPVRCRAGRRRSAPQSEVTGMPWTPRGRCSQRPMRSLADTAIIARLVVLRPRHPVGYGHSADLPELCRDLVGQLRRPALRMADLR
jgi:hypothetical protein